MANMALVEQYIQRHDADGLTWREVGAELGLTRDQVRSAVKRHYAKTGRKSPTDVGDVIPPTNAQTGARAVTSHSDITTTDQRRIALDAYLGTSAVIPDGKRAAADRRKVIALADLHGSPSPDILNAVVNEQPDDIVIAGDLLDSAQSSAWGKPIGESDKQLTIRQEMADVRAFIETLLMRTRADIHVMRGNHDQWSMRTASQLLPVHLLEFFRDPFDVLLEGLPSARVYRVRTAFDYTFPDSSHSPIGETEYTLKFGDAIISHANFVGTNAGDAVRKLSDWVHKWRRTLDLGDPVLFIQAHVHSVALIEQDSGHRVLVEMGAACEPSAESYKIGYASKWKSMSLGCVAFDQHNNGADWLTDLSSVRLIRPRR
jgi:predicted phosphodiesterase